MRIGTEVAENRGKVRLWSFVYFFLVATPTTTRIKLRIDDDRGAVSLGLPCVTDLQCRTADPYSKCRDGICDCILRSNSTASCSARNRGCIPGTFQVSDIELNRGRKK